MLPEDEKLLKLAEAAVSKMCAVYGGGMYFVTYDARTENDAEYIAAAVIAVPRLLGRLKDATEALNLLADMDLPMEAHSVIRRALAADEAAAKEQV